jgi:hypothetical protein
MHDGWDRPGMVNEARGDNRQTADCCRKVIDFMHHHPDHHDTDMVEQLVDAPDPVAATSMPAHRLH